MRSLFTPFPARIGFAALWLGLYPHADLQAQSSVPQGVWPSWAFGSAPRMRLIQDRTHACLRRDQQQIYNNLLCVPFDPTLYPTPYDPDAPELDMRIENGGWIGTDLPLGCRELRPERPFADARSPFVVGDQRADYRFHGLE